jgi:hypothetical protein
MSELHEPAAGEVLITDQPHGRYLVEIGRGRYVKRFNLSHDEAAQIAAMLAAKLPAVLTR